MITEEPKPLPAHLEMRCYACKTEMSTHLCRFKSGELIIQICLCPACMQMDTERLMKHTIGIQESGHQTLPVSLFMKDISSSDQG